MFGGIGKVGADALIGFVDGLKSVSQFLKDNQEQVTKIQTSFGLVFGEIGKVLGGLGDIVAALGLAGTQSGAFATALQSVGIIIAGIRDGVTIISASFAEVGAGILGVISLIADGWAKIIGLVNKSLGDSLQAFADNTKAQADAAHAAVKQVDDDFANGKTAVQEYADNLEKAAAAAKGLNDESKLLAEGSKAIDVSTAATQQLQTNLQALKVDVGTLSGGVSDFAAAGVRSFTQLADNAGASGKQIRAALEGAIDTAKTVADIDALREALIHAAGQGKISGEDLVRAIESIDDAGRKAAGTIDGPLGESLKRLGIQTKGQLNELARQAEDDYRRVTKSAEVSVDGQLAALNKLIAAEKAANNGRVSIELTTQKEILEALKAATEAATAEGFAVRQAARDKADEKDANERLKASEKELAEARKQAAEAATKEQAAAKSKEQGLKDFGGVIAAIINNVENLSSKAAAAFDSAFGIPVKNAQGSLEALQASLKKVNDEIFFNLFGFDSPWLATKGI